MTRPRVHVMAEAEDLARPDACAALRLVDPYSSAAVAEVADVSFGRAVPDDAEVLVMQRLGRAAGDVAVVQDLVRGLPARGIRLVYDLDDNLLDPHPDPDSETVIARHRCSVLALLRAADRVTVSTPALRERVQRLNPAVTVLPNALDERRIGVARPVRPAGSGLRIGYFGTFTHLRDLMAVAGPVRAALARLPHRPTVCLCGISTDARLAELFADVAAVEIVPATGDYGSFVGMMQGASWDIGLAPLAGGAFEAAKSDIKFLDYAAFGIAGLYAAHPAYDAVVPGVTGLVGPPADWTALLSALAGDAGLRDRIAGAADGYLRRHRTLQGCGGDWAGIIRFAAG